MELRVPGLASGVYHQTHVGQARVGVQDEGRVAHHRHLGLWIRLQSEGFEIKGFETKGFVIKDFGIEGFEIKGFQIKVFDVQGFGRRVRSTRISALA